MKYSPIYIWFQNLDKNLKLKSDDFNDISRKQFKIEQNCFLNNNLEMSIRKPLKILLLGNASVGKTSILQSYVDQKFTGRYKATIGADLSLIQTTVKGVQVSLEIWDTAGQERFNSLGGAFYRNTDCCVIVYDITDSSSFKSVSQWRDVFIEGCGPKQPTKFPFIIIGNKIDRESERSVQLTEVEQLLNENKNFCHLNVSAKDKTGLENVVALMAQKANDNRVTEIFIPSPIILISKKPVKKPENCCLGR